MRGGLQRWLMGSVVAGFVLLAAIYSVVNPLFEAPDEIWHYEYVRWLAQGEGLARPEDVGRAPWRQEGSQPPLYYLLAAGLTWPLPSDNAAVLLRYNPHAAVGQGDAPDNKNMLAHGAADGWPWRGVVLAAHVTRLFSVLLGAITVACTIGLARTIAPQAGAAPVLAGLLVAANPQFLFVSAAVSNDNLVTACCAGALWLLVHLLGQPQPASLLQLVGLGLLVGAAALSKVSGLALAVPAMFVLAWLAWRWRQPGRFFAQTAVVGGVALLVAGWWYWRNWQLFGDPLALSLMFAVLPGRGDPLTLAEVISLAPGIWRSYWAVFGWFNVVAEPAVYICYTVIVGLCLVGILVGGWRRRATGFSGRAADWLLLTGWTALLLILVVRWAQISYPQGRLLFPAAPAIATVLAVGWSGWWARRSGWGGLLLALLLIPPALAAPWRWIAPAYRPPATLAADGVVPNPVAVQFADQMALRGYSWQPDELRPGGVLDLTLYWTALRPPEADYSVFVHLVDEYGIVQAQRDSYPAGGSLPTGDWTAGRLIPDRHQVAVPVVLPAPANLRIEVGLYDFASGQRLPPNLASAGMADAYLVGHVPVVPAPAGERQPLAINFGDEIELVDFAFDRWLVPAGEALTVTLQWAALQPPQQDYMVFVHLLLPPDAVWAQRDAMPQDGARPTSGWQRGEVVADRYVVNVPAEAPAGLYNIEIGLYDPASGARLKVDLSDAGVRLGQVRVTR